MASQRPRAPSAAPRSSAEASDAAADDRRRSPETQAAPAARIASFPELVALAGEKRDLLTKAAHLEADVRLVRFEDGRLEVAMERTARRGR